MLPSDIRSIHQAYGSIYEGTDLITDELVEEIVEELISECVEFGYTLDEAVNAVEEAAYLYFDSEDLEEAKVTYGSDTESPEQRRERAKAKVGEKKVAARKAAVKGAVERVKAKATGAAAGAGIAASIAKDEARRAARKAAHTVTHTVQKKKAEVKSGVKSLLGKGLRKAAGAVGKVAQKAAGAASKLGEEVQQLDEISDKKVQQVVNARNRRFDRSVDSGAPNREFHQARRSNELAARRNARTGSNVKVDPILSKEEVDTWDVVLEYLITNGHADTNAEALYVMSQLDEEMIQSILEGSYEDRIAANNKKYDAARKRAAQRAAARNAARDAGQTGAVPGVGYVTPRRERTSYTDSSGTQRHHSGAKMP